MSEKNPDRSELGIWAEGTPYTITELANWYRDYCLEELEAGREPDDEAGFCEHVVGINPAGDKLVEDAGQARLLQQEDTAPVENLAGAE